MAERKATNKYYPPEWEPKHGSINKFRGQHPLRDRARKLDKGILIVRFEMPYNVWCTGCDQHIGKGVRYNAEKKQAGTYFTTKIWSFRMKCHLCSNWMEVRTDPKNRDYEMFDGVKRKSESWEGGEEQGTIAMASTEEKEKLEDPFYRLEHKSEDVKKAEAKKPALQRLLDFNERSFDDYAASQLLRKGFREEKQVIKELKEEAKEKGLAITLLPHDPVDEVQAKQVEFEQTDEKQAKLKEKKMSIRAAPILSTQTLPQSKTHNQSILTALAKAKKAKMNLGMLKAINNNSNTSSSSGKSGALSLAPSLTIQKPKHTRKSLPFNVTVSKAL